MSNETQPDNPPAFPQTGVVNPVSHGNAWASEPHPGMTLRDWFAGQALAGIITAPDQWTADRDASAPIQTWGDLASASYQAADAMLRAREAKP